MSWKAIEPLPVSRYRAAAAAHKNYLYVMGGASAYNLSAMPLTVLKCRVDAGGESSSPWTECAPAFAVGKTGARTLVVGNEHLMVLGGFGITPYGGDLQGAQDIYVGKLDADGNIPQWTILAGAAL